VSEFKTEPKSPTVDKSTERNLLTIDQPFPNHNGGQLQFGPADGMLYIGMGDGGSAHDPMGNGQNFKSLLGKMLRIDVTPRQGYGIPKDNPFVGDDKYAPEIWATGMRNPWRFSFDEQTGLLYAADVGQDIWEEIDVIEKGKNYGWRVREGFHELHSVSDPPEFAEPIFEYEHGTKDKRMAASVTGGYVYWGKKLPALAGCYVFADYVDGRMWAIRYEGGKVVASDVIVDPKNPEKNGGQRPTQPAGFGVGPDGELYMLDANGPVYRIAPAE
jgi:glucose/arabinose dehydrogenase